MHVNPTIDETTRKVTTPGLTFSVDMAPLLEDVVGNGDAGNGLEDKKDFCLVPILGWKESYTVVTKMPFIQLGTPFWKEMIVDRVHSETAVRIYKKDPNYVVGSAVYETPNDADKSNDLSTPTKSWASRYWWVILIIVISVVLVIGGIVGFVMKRK